MFWKGVDYSSTTKPTSLQHVYISDAYEAIRSRYILPNLYHVTVRNSFFGVAAEEMTFPLAIRDSIIKDSLIEGIRVKSGLVMTTIENTMVHNTTYGDGLSYSGTLGDSFDFCSVDVNNITFPITFQALGKSRASISCAKVRIFFFIFISHLFLSLSQLRTFSINHRDLNKRRVDKVDFLG